MNLENQESIYKSLLKVNQIGKKLSPNSLYILTNGVMISYYEQEMSDTEANHIGMAFLDNSLHKKLDGIGDNIGILIDGDKLYELSKNYDFDSISLTKHGININFIYYAVNESNYEERFKDILRAKKFSEDEILIASNNDYKNNIDIYDLYLKYKKENKPVEERSTISTTCKFITTDNYMYQKTHNIINEINNSELLYYDDIQEEILNLVLNSRHAITLKFPVEGKDFKIRFMKSLFNPITSKSTSSILIYKNSNRYLLGIQINLTGMIVVKIYSIVNY